MNKVAGLALEELRKVAEEHTKHEEMLFGMQLIELVFEQELLLLLTQEVKLNSHTQYSTDTDDSYHDHVQKNAENR
jgi:hypothetical protein